MTSASALRHRSRSSGGVCLDQPLQSGSSRCVEPPLVWVLDMIDLKLEEPTTEDVEVDAETSAAIETGISAADEGRTVPINEVRKMIPLWISRFESQTRR